ncbi:MAG: transglycosylase SLT domain-containing protein [Pseudonocardia sp.]|nr:transglycosylase SLT domain-containing protein [Pseudonocardia sp.]
MDASEYVRSADRAAEKTERLAREADRFSGKRYVAYAGVDGAEKAQANLERIRRELNSIDGRNVKARVQVQTQPASRDVALLGNLIAALGPAGIAAGAAGSAGLLALGSTLGTVAAAGGVTMLAFGGIGDTLDKVNKAQLDPTEAHLKAAKLAMQELSASGRHFVKFLDDLEPKIDSLEEAAQAGLLPGVERGLTSLTKILPDVRGLIGETASQLGNLAAQGGAALTSPFWQGYVKFLQTNMGPTLQSFGQIIGGVVHGLAGVQIAFNPLAQDLLRGLGELSQRFASWGEGLSTNRNFQEFVDYVRQTGPQVLDTIGSIANALLKIGQAAAPLGGPVLAIIGGIADALAAVAASPVGTPIMAAAAAFGALGLALRGIDVARTSAVVGAMRSLPGAIAAGSLNAGVFAEKMGLSADKSEKLASAGGKISGALGKVGSALPIVGIAAIGLGFAYDELRDKSDDFAKSVIDGSMSMQDAINAERNSIEKRNFWIADTTPHLDDEAEARQNLLDKLRANIDSMQGEEKARGRAILAQADYNQKVIDFGEHSPEAIAAQRDLTAATAAETDERRRAAVATRDQATALRELQGWQMSAAESDIGYRQALLNRKQAQEDATKATREHGKGSDEAQQANIRLEQADLAVVAAADRLSEANLAGASATDKAELSSFNHTNTVLGLASGINGQASPALIDMASKMTNSELAAHNAKIETDGLDFTVRKLPDGRTIKIATDSAVREAENAVTLKKRIEELPLYRDMVVRAKGEWSLGTYQLGDGTTGGGARNSAGGTFQSPGRQYATGGYITGPGTATSDSILARLSRGEYVVRAAAVNRVGVATLDRLNRTGMVPGLPAFADGGVVGSAQYPAMIDSVETGMYAKIAARVAEQMSSFGAGAYGGGGSIGGAGVQRWAPLVLQALAMLGQPASYLGITLRRMNQESGGNPNIVNNWDINAKRGTPSGGLMQTIAPTYRAYADPRRNLGMFDPLSNILASMRYALARYGSLPAAYNKPGGYANGGIVPGTLPGDRYLVAAQAGERVLTKAQTRSYDRMVDVLDRPRPVPYVQPTPGSAGAAAPAGPKVQFGDVHVAQPVDIDLLSDRMEFAIAATSF